MLGGRAQAELRRHGWVIFHLGLRRNEVISEMARPRAGIDAELDPERLAQREAAVISEEPDVVIILADGAERQACIAPAQIGFAERDFCLKFLRSALARTSSSFEKKSRPDFRRRFEMKGF